MTRRRIPIAMLLAVVFSATAVPRSWARPQETPAEAAGPTVSVPKLDRPPKLENFLGMEPDAQTAGKMAKVEGSFLQRVPTDDAPSTERTDVYLGYDDDHLYAVFVAFDSEPAKIRANLTRRDGFFGDDLVQIMVDTFHDQRRAYSFICNPYGVQLDSIWTEGKDFDLSFDTVWSAAGKITDRGYVVWMSIPFKSLRFPQGSEQTWGLLLNRDIPRKSEETFWPRYTLKIQGRLNQMGELTGLRDISPGRNLLFIPYATARSFRILEEATPSGNSYGGRSFESDAGLDVKAVFRDRLVLDVTMNPDFNQVESDEPQVTVNQRFEVYFPEKRPFFLENAPYFQTPIDLVFTRRIADPRVGARLTGKLGPWAFGALVIDDESPGKTVPPDDALYGKAAGFGILRLNRDVSAQSTLGMLYTDRELAGGYNRVGSLDARVKWNDNWTSDLQAATSRTGSGDGQESQGNAFHVEAGRTGEHVELGLVYADVAPGFVTATGFVPRRDIREARGDFSYTFRPDGKRLLAWAPELFGRYTEDYAGTRLDQHVRPEIGFEWRGQTRLFLATDFGRERLRPKDVCADPAVSCAWFPDDRDYSILEHAIEFETEYWRTVALQASLYFGHGINFVPVEGTAPYPADTLYASAGVTARPTARLRFDARWILSRLTEQDTGDPIFTNQIVQVRGNLQFTPRASLRLIARYDRTDADPALTSLANARNVNGDLLFTYQVNPWTALYAGYNSNYAQPPFIRGVPAVTDTAYLNDSRQVFVKFSYLFRL